MGRKKLNLKALLDTPPWEWPEDTGAALLTVLQDEKAAEADRILAADLAGSHTVIDDKIASALLSIVGDKKKSEELRCTAAISLGPVLEHADLMGFDDPDDVVIEEPTFRKIQQALQELHADEHLPLDLRRRALEAAVRAPLSWHEDAIKAAYSSDERLWRLTAVFCMRYVKGFDDLILEALHERDPEIHCEAVLAAGAWGLEAAWPHITSLVRSKRTEKALLVAAIEASANIRPEEVAELLDHLVDSEDEDIAAAVADAIEMAEGGDEDEGEDDFSAADEEGDDEDDEDDESDDAEGGEDDDEDGSGKKVLN